MTTTTTRAGRLAESYAAPLRAAGWTVDITTSHTPPELLDGEVLLDGYTFVHVHARRYIYDGTFAFSWCTRDGAGDHRATTSYLGGEHRQFASRKTISLNTYARLASWVHICTTL